MGFITGQGMPASTAMSRSSQGPFLIRQSHVRSVRHALGSGSQRLKPASPGLRQSSLTNVVFDGHTSQCEGPTHAVPPTQLATPQLVKPQVRVVPVPMGHAPVHSDLGAPVESSAHTQPADVG